MGSDCVSVHAQSIFTIPSFLFFPPQVGSLHPQMSHLLICCATQFSACLCVCARACVRVSQCVTFKYAFMIPREFFFFLKNKDDSVLWCAAASPQGCSLPCPNTARAGCMLEKEPGGISTKFFRLVLCP